MLPLFILFLLSAALLETLKTLNLTNYDIFLFRWKISKMTNDSFEQGLSGLSFLFI